MADFKSPLVDPDKIIRDVFFDKTKVDSQTELDPRQIEAVSKLKTLARLFGSDLLDLHLDEMMLLQKSKNRGSMKEFVESLRSKKEDLAKDKKFMLMG